MQVFFSFLGFESVASAAEETRNPPMDLPIGIIAALAVCASLYALMCVTIVGMVPWQQIDIDTPFSSAYRDIGWTWAGKVVAVGAIMGIVTSLMMSLFGQIRLLMCLGRERMLPARVVRSYTSYEHLIWGHPLCCLLSAVCNLYSLFRCIVCDEDSATKPSNKRAHVSKETLRMNCSAVCP